MSELYFCGIDEAGRGPVIGPMVMAAAIFEKSDLERLGSLGVKDSKRLSPKKRANLETDIKEIAKEYYVRSVSAQQIDSQRKVMSLNEIEARETAMMIQSIECACERIVVDAADSIAENYAKKIRFWLNDLDPGFKPVNLLAEHRADDNYLEASAASILAKVERDRAIEGLRGKWGDFGSGYPADPKTAKFIRELLRQGEMPEFVRQSWNTIEKNRQMSISDYSIT